MEIENILNNVYENNKSKKFEEEICIKSEEIIKNILMFNPDLTKEEAKKQFYLENIKVINSKYIKIINNFSKIDNKLLNQNTSYILDNDLFYKIKNTILVEYQNNDIYSANWNYTINFIKDIKVYNNEENLIEEDYLLKEVKEFSLRSALEYLKNISDEIPNGKYDIRILKKRNNDIKSASLIIQTKFENISKTCTLNKSETLDIGISNKQLANKIKEFYDKDRLIKEKFENLKQK